MTDPLTRLGTALAEPSRINKGFTMPRRLQLLLVVLLTAAGVGTAHAQADAVAAQIDEYWTEVARTVAEGDLEGYWANFHPDAVGVGRDTSGTLRTRLIAEQYERSIAGTAEVRAGRVWRRIEFRLASRLHDSATAHVVGLSHFRRTAEGDPPVDRYDGVDSYLVRRNGRWVMLLNFQAGPATKAEWDALDSPTLGYDEPQPQ